MIGEIPCACPDCNFRLRELKKELDKERSLSDRLEEALKYTRLDWSVLNNPSGSFGHNKAIEALEAVKRAREGG